MDVNVLISIQGTFGLSTIGDGFGAKGVRKTTKRGIESLKEVCGSLVKNLEPSVSC